MLKGLLLSGNLRGSLVTSMPHLLYWIEGYIYMILSLIQGDKAHVTLVTCFHTFTS